MTEFVYKICSASEWAQAVASGRFSGSEDDLRDGFIHFSTRQQLKETASKHFHGCDDLVLVTVPALRLGQSLKWEPSRGGDMFPHLYGDLAMEDVYTVQPLPQDADGTHIFPEDLA